MCFALRFLFSCMHLKIQKSHWVVAGVFSFFRWPLDDTFEHAPPVWEKMGSTYELTFLLHSGYSPYQLVNILNFGQDPHTFFFILLKSPGFFQGLAGFPVRKIQLSWQTYPYAARAWQSLVARCMAESWVVGGEKWWRCQVKYNTPRN